MPVRYIDEDKVSFSTRRHILNSEFDVSRVRQLPKVSIVYSYVEPDTATIQALVSGGTQGIVFAGTASF